MGKGISTVIATILMLMIVIALAGSAYMFISGIFTGKVATSFSLVDTYNDTLTIRNDGTTPITSFTSFTVDGNPASVAMVRVLSIYPNGAPSCGRTTSCFVLTVVNNDGNNLLKVDCLGVNEFNAGNYNLNNYDVVIFDAADCWDCAIDPEEKTALKSFVQRGGGLIATHDALCCGCGFPGSPALGATNSIVDIFGLTCGGLDQGFNTIYRTRTGDITNYPYSTAATMSVLGTHTECGGITVSGATRWYEHTSPANDVGNDIALVTNNYGSGRTAKIWWGHTQAAPAAGSEESKLIINTLHWAANKNLSPGRTVTIKILNPLSRGTHTVRICTPSMCITGYLTII